jgi:hypothetical protein
LIARSLGLKSHEFYKFRACASVEQISGWDAKSLQVFNRQVNAPFTGVLTDVSDDIGQLESETERLSIRAGAFGLPPKNVGGHGSDNARHPIAIHFEVSKSGISSLIKVHLHAIEHRL